MITAQTTIKTLQLILPELISSEFGAAPLGPLQLDSRRVECGDTFVAIEGFNANGSRYIEDALGRGASCIFQEGDVYSACRLDSHLRVTVPDLATQLSVLAGRYYDHASQQLTITAVTGTNGKTTCTQWLGQLLALVKIETGTVGTLGYGLSGEKPSFTGFTTPDAISTQRILRELAEAGAKAVVLEASSHSLVQGRLTDVAIDIAVLTNIGRDHLDYHGTFEAYVAAKKILMRFSSLHSAVINRDEPYADDFIEALANDCRLVTFSVGNTNTEAPISKGHVGADFVANEVIYHSQGMAFTLCTPVGTHHVKLPLWGAFNLSNVLAVTAAAYAQGINVEDIVQCLPKLSPVAGRMEAIPGDWDVSVLVDFAHTADALQSVLSAIRAHSTKKLWCIFGCGGDRDKGKRPLMAAVAEALADEVVVTSDNPRTESAVGIVDDIVSGFKAPARASVIEDRRQAITETILSAAPGDCILVAGKGHENYQIVGDTKYPFSDIHIAKSALLERAAGGRA